jgi:hypothetical protein
MDASVPAREIRLIRTLVGRFFRKFYLLNGVVDLSEFELYDHSILSAKRRLLKRLSLEEF